MTDLEKKIINLAQKHSEFDEVKALSELKYMNDVEPDLIGNLWSLHISSQERGEIRSENKLNSYLAYYLDITNCKPTEVFKIEKRRTYGRSGFPDIDMDFDWSRRQEIIDYLIEKYGREYVGNIGTVQTLKTKAAVRRAVKVLDPTDSLHFDDEGKVIKSDTNESFALENEILGTLPKIMQRPDGTKIESVDEACEEYPEFNKYMKKYTEVYKISKRLEGTVSGFGCHAAGILISPIPLSEIAPMHVTRRKGKKKSVDGAEGEEDRVIATQFTMADVERMGLIKFDILGLSTKTAINWACRSLSEKDINIDWNKIPLDDEATFQFLQDGHTQGLFQLESHGMRDCLKMIGMDSFDDLVVAIAMFRPGPKDYIPEFAGRKKGKITVTYPHSSLQNITEETFGILCFQEQVMQAFMGLADLTASDGYAFMKGCAKKKPEIIQGYKKKFFRGAGSQGIDLNVVQDIWNDLEKFGGYSFNKSHSVSYAYESYKTAYLKAHYPTEFIAARLSVETRRRHFDTIDNYKRDAIKNLGFTLEPMDINKSKVDWVIEGTKILRMPLLTKGLGIKAAEEIVAHQPYTGKDLLLSFGRKVGKTVNHKVVEAMIDAGLWRGMNKEKLLADFAQIKKDKRRSLGRVTQDMFA